MEVRPKIHYRFGGQCDPEHIARYILAPSSFECVEKISNKLDKPRKLAQHYEWLLYGGEYKGVPITVCSTGIGGASVAVALEELADLGADTFVRIDYAQPVRFDSDSSDLIIPTGAMRLDGISDDYVRPEYPACAHHEIILAGIATAEKLGLEYRTEVICSMAATVADSPKGSHHYRSQQITSIRERCLQSDVRVIDGEAATMFVICGIYGFRCGAFLRLPRFDETGHIDDSAEDELILAGLETIYRLSIWDQRIERQKKKFIYLEP